MAKKGNLIAIKEYMEREDNLCVVSRNKAERKCSMSELTEVKKACSTEELDELGRQAREILGYSEE